MKRNSDFKFDLLLGQLAEKSLAEVLTDKRIEVKRDFAALKTNNVFIEYNSRGNPSGISKTEADYYCFVLSDKQYIIIETEDLKERCRKYIKTNRDVVGGDNNTSKGILLPLKDLIE